MKRNSCRVGRLAFLVALAFLVHLPSKPRKSLRSRPPPLNQVLEWNQVFIDTLIATNTANSSSQRLGAIFHTAIFDAYNGIERRYTPSASTATRLRGASRRAAVIAAAYTALVGLFPSLTPAQRDARGIMRLPSRRLRATMAAHGGATRRARDHLG